MKRSSGSPVRAFGRAVTLAYAVALVALFLPFGPALATGASATEPARAFGGFVTSSWAAPVKLEIYEPMIPLPVTPQVELGVGYSVVEADAGQSRGRSSLLWPGDSIGEGFKTIIELLGLPPTLGEDGYPIQVNSRFPAGPARESDEPFPGMIQRAGSDEGSSYAETGFSTDSSAQDRGDGDGDDGLIPGLPLPGLDGLLGLFSPSVGADGEETPSSLGLPPALFAVVDLGGFTSVARTDTNRTVTSMARSSFGDIALLGGLIRVEGLKVRAEVSSDGTKGQARGIGAYGELVALGQRFAFGPDGLEAVGQHLPIPGLPDQVPAALSKLGVTISFPKPVYETHGDSASASVTGMVVEIDMGPLKKVLNQLPLADLVGMLPEQAGQLKDVLGLVTGLSSRIVVSLGNARAAVDTSPRMEFPVIQPQEPGTDVSTQEPGLAVPPVAPAVDTPPTTDTPPGTTTATSGDLDTVPLGAGLPPLFSVPGLLLVGGIAAATVTGSYFRRVGAAALGGGASCPHGLESGLPDLRKA